MRGAEGEADTNHIGRPRGAQASIEEAKQASKFRSEPPISAPPMDVGRGCLRLQSFTSVRLLMRLLRTSYVHVP